MDSSRISFCILLFCITVSAQNDGCTKETKKESESDCDKWITVLGASTEDRPDSITFRSYLYCARVLQELCGAIISYEDVDEVDMVKVVVDYNQKTYCVRTYKNEAKTELNYMSTGTGHDDDDDDDDGVGTHNGGTGDDDDDDDDAIMEKSAGDS